MYRGEFEGGEKHGQGYETEGKGEIAGKWVKGKRHGVFSQEVEEEGVVSCFETQYDEGVAIASPKRLK